jgi:predicted DNA-binding protein (MmcQ/YjbR family)
MMDVTELINYCLQKKGAAESFPFNPDTLVLKVGEKMFALIPLDVQPSTISVKTDPEWSAELREQHPQITGAYHMNKTHWNSVLCEGLKQELILKLVDHSYNLIVASLPKKMREKVFNS